MAEHEGARAERRRMSAELTAQINSAACYPRLRRAVIETLQALNTRLKELEASFRSKNFLRNNAVLLKFYMKGGNAFACLLNPEARTKLGGGDSDWDTQIVVNPWLPRPLQERLCQEIDEVVVDELRAAGVHISDVIGQPGNPVEFPATRNDFMTYTLRRDNPQTLRMVFDHDRIGLSTNDRHRLSDEGTAHPDLIPGILVNDAIRQFKIYRLGYTWHAEATDEEAPRIKRPVLMELIDVTVPRGDTIEAVAIWSELERAGMNIVEHSVSVVDATAMAPMPAVQLPLPGLYYHLQENAIMLCEIAAGESRHADKKNKRIDRIRKIADAPEASHGAVASELCAIAGLYSVQFSSLNDLVEAMEQEIKNRKALTDFDDQGKVLKTTRERILAARLTLKSLLDTLLGGSGMTPPLGAYSDDLVLVSLLEHDQYMAASKLKFSGIDQAAVLRVENREAMNKLCEHFRRRLGNCILKEREHNIARSSGRSYERTLLLFQNDGRPFACITLTTASEAEAPFRADPVDGKTLCCAAADLAGQRLVAAALIPDYSVRTAISGQYEALKLLLPLS